MKNVYSSLSSYLNDYLQAKKDIKRQVEKIKAEQGPDAVPKFPVRTIESAREEEDFMVEQVDEDITAEEATDEYAPTYSKVFRY